MATNPILVEVVRGEMVESTHRGAAAVVSVDGSVPRSWGDIESPVYARSAYRYWNYAGARLTYFGLRVAADLER